jgi:pimeloyl-ACP methyl ester carboxylesterase
VASDAEGIVNDNCWTDFYTNLGFDVFLFNYAGFGRSYGTASCGMLRRGGDEAYHPGLSGRLRRICHGTFFSFQTTPDSLRADGLAVSTHLVSHLGVESLVIHGESIGGVAASGAAAKLTESPFLRDKVALLICDRTFTNLEAVAQRLVGGWSGYAIRALAPFWSTDVAGYFLAANCPKVVANDCADAIIADTSSLKSGIAFWKEVHRGAASTKGIGWILDAPVEYRMADWENVCVNGKNESKQLMCVFEIESELTTSLLASQTRGMSSRLSNDQNLQSGRLISISLLKKLSISQLVSSGSESLHPWRRRGLLQ